MMRVLTVLLFMSCQPIKDTTGELAGVADRKRVYLQLDLRDAKVMRGTKGFDPRMPAKIYALSYTASDVKNLQLSDKNVNVNHLITFDHVLFSWHYDKGKSPVYTCPLRGVSLGEQRNIIDKGQRNAPYCFAEEGGKDYVRLLADHCLGLSDSEKSRFVFFEEGKEFACDLSEKGDKGVVLHASCLTKDSNCLDDGNVHTCASSIDGFANFVEQFKQHVNSGTCDDKGCEASYTLKGVETTEETETTAETTEIAAETNSASPSNSCFIAATPAEPTEAAQATSEAPAPAAETTQQDGGG